MDLADHRLVTLDAVVLSHSSIERRNSNWFGKTTQREGHAVFETIQTLHSPFGDCAVVRCMTVVAGCHRLVAGSVPIVELVSHDVAVHAGRGVV